MAELNKETLTTFLNNLPTARKIEREAGLPRGYLDKIKREARPLSEETKAKLLPVLNKFGFNK
ncbi:DeoR family transcriptional regulator [Adhaeribacter rhizoryzae]|uniref:DeoR family transcriptional regulator n=1 Tax=Adhaeribacter rhizoryzae TaxID=2607907 RepID=A0A5M6DRR5_9BACT|nr:DeoR family transcriptional regulator [Adhaeribacter rhizoryzae]KAA5548095.1 DeoR family transcriptional regulator [Adhaeribacter rhizoryzae]